MKQLRVWTMCLLWACSTLTYVYAQSYKALWNGVDILIKKDYPQSVIDKTQQIYEKAVTERNVPQMLKAYLVMMREQSKLTPDSFYVDIRALEAWAADTSTSVCDAAVIHSLLGEIYYKTSSAKGKVQHQSLGIFPEDMAEWSRTMYLQQAFKHYIESVKELEKLQECGVKDYEPLTYQGKWSDYYNHDLMHLIGRRATLGLRNLERLRDDYEQTPWSEFPINYVAFRNYTFHPVSDYDCRTEAMRIFHRMQSLLQQPAAQDGWLLMELNRLNMIFSERSKSDIEEQIKTLEVLKQEFVDCELNAAVYYELAMAYGNSGNKVEQLRLAREAMKIYPKYGGINFFRNMEKEILLPAINWTLLRKNYYGSGYSATGRHLYPHDTVQIKVRFRNLDGFKIWLHKVNLPADTVSNYLQKQDWLKNNSSFHSERSYTLHNNEEYQWQDTVINLVLPESGIYLVETLANQKASNHLELLVVSRLFLQSSNYYPDNKVRLMVLDAKSGHPIPNAKVVKGHKTKTDRNESWKYSAIKTYSTGCDGMVCIDKDMKNIAFRAYTTDDEVMLFKDFWDYSYVPQVNNTEKQYVKLFTDRDLYRPGQTIMVKGIVFEKKEPDSLFVLSGEEYKLTLRSRTTAGLLDSMIVRTNEYGTLSGKFVLPFYVSSNQVWLNIINVKTNEVLDSKYIRVEEYKRPTFEAAFDSIRQVYAMGDSVTLTGIVRTYSGVPLANAKVDACVNVHKSHYRHYWWDLNNKFSTINLPSTKTDEEGRFKLKVYLKPDKELTNNIWWSSQYGVDVTITSLSGESQSVSTNLQLSSCPLLLNIANAEPEWLKGADQMLFFDVQNLNHSPIDTQIKYRLIQGNNLLDREEINNTQILSGKVVREGVAPSNQKVTMEWLDSLPSGVYQMVAQTALPGGKDSVSHSRIFTLYADNETKVPIGHKHWHKWLQEDFAEGEPACLQLGVKDKDVYVLMDISTEQQLLETRTFILSDTVQTFTFDYEPRYGKGLNVRCVYVKDGCFYTLNHSIQLKRPNKSLNLKWITFRDKLRPGQKETWTLSVLTSTGAPVNAEVLASMYDASLDKLGGLPAKWNLYLPYSWMNVPSWSWTNLTKCSTKYSSINFPLTYLKVSSNWRYDNFIDRLTDMGVPVVRNTMTALDVVPSLKASGVNTMRLKGLDGESADEQFFVKEKVVEEESVSTTSSSSSSSLPSLRENFNETAFFQPHLRTDSLGNVQINFILPESLTRWKFRALAHSQIMEFGYLESEVVAQKDFMIQPNLPRFVRMGDEVSILSSLVNLSNKHQQGIARMELLNPETEQVIFTMSKDFAVQKNQTSYLSFEFSVPEDVSLLICRIIAEGEDFSDGEQRYLPVLSDKIQLIESLPFVINQSDTLQLSFNKLFNNQSETVTNRRLTVELTGNPSWLAVQALPAIANPENEDALSWAIAYYARELSAYILHMNPRIKEVFEQWHIDKVDQESLWSRLQRNQELKTLLLEETPWLAEAENEMEQRKRLDLLFNATWLNETKQQTLTKLATLQSPDGGWSWYKGMNTNRFITTRIMLLFERLSALTVKSNEASMIQSAKLYLDRELEAEYNKMLKQEGKGIELISPSEWVLEYLYSQALTDRKWEGTQQEAVDYILDKFAKLPRQQFTIQGKAYAAIILWKNGRENLAKEFLNSMLEHTVYSPEKGRGFETIDTNNAWNDYSILVQVNAMEALSLICPNEIQMLEQMKLWLLMQKRVLCWDTPFNTANAVYALLMYSDELFTKDSSIRLWIGEHEVKNNVSHVPGLNYQKQTFVENEIEKLQPVIRIEKSNKGMAWGALYAQCLEDIEQIERSSAASGLSKNLRIERKYLIERVRGEKSEWIPVTKKRTMHLGDKLISRMVITVKEDMEFVQLKAPRPACAEPLDILSGYRYNGEIGYYHAVKDASSHYFFDRLPKGTYIINQEMRIDHIGCYQAAPAILQSAYAPEFVAYSNGELLEVEE